MTWLRFFKRRRTDSTSWKDLSYQPKKHHLSVPGKFYVSEDCLACENCQIAAPGNFRYGDVGQTYVFKQPETTEEEEKCRQAVLDCPVEAVRDDGVTQ